MTKNRSSFIFIGVYWSNHHHGKASAAVALYVAVAAIWFVPDRRIERTVAARAS